MTVCECGNPFTPTSKGHGKIRCRTCVTNLRRFDKKKKAVEYLGGKCVDCGYDTCMEAMEFDHIDPTTKEFSISGNHCISWERLRQELNKCELRCANCHRERHAREKSQLSTEYVVEQHIVRSVCKNCGVGFDHSKSDNRIYCSTKCSGNNRTKIVWPDISSMIDMIKTSSFTQVSSILGVTDNSIRKYLIRNGIDPKSVRNVKDNKFMRR